MFKFDWEILSTADRADRELWGDIKFQSLFGGD